MKQIIVILLIFFLIGCENNEKKSTSSKLLEDSIRISETLKLDNSLQECTISYIYGDEVIIENIIRISKKNNKFYAENIEPIEFYGTHIEKPWKVELSEEDIKLIIDYINKSRIIANTKYSIKYLQSQMSTSVENYLIEFSDDTIKVPHIYWEQLDFISLRKKIFKNKYDALNKMKEKINNEIAKSIAGKWYYTRVENLTIENDTITLEKNKRNHNCYISLDTEYNFHSTCYINSENVDYKYYSLDLDRQNNLYIITQDKKNYKDDDRYYNYERYKIVYYDTQKIKMRSW